MSGSPPEGFKTDSIASKCVIKLYLRATITRSRSRYEVRLDSPNGEVLIPLARDPFTEGCRKLFNRGYLGQAELWDADRDYARLRGSIERHALLTVEENRTHGPRLRSIHRTHNRQFTSVFGAAGEGKHSQDMEFIETRVGR